LPENVPVIDGWSIAATLIPAWQTSGDFYDFIELPNGKLGVLVADVADKGTGSNKSVLRYLRGVSASP